MKYILQDKNYALGNFINVTPVIKYLFETTEERVNVFFETEYVKECYKNSPYINILETKPHHLPFCSSSLINKANTRPDYQFVFKTIIGEDWTNKYKPFVDDIIIDSTLMPKKYVVIINGSGSENETYVDSKNPGNLIYNQIVKDLELRGYTTYFTGSQNDFDRSIIFTDEDWIGDIQLSLALINGADLIITNDTGLCHCAGCYDKNQFILWKDTKFEKNKNSGINSFYSQKGNWSEDYKKWIETV